MQERGRPEPERADDGVGGGAQPGPRRRRRAVGPPGAVRVEDEPLAPRTERAPAPGDDERLRADRPPHHDRGV